MTQTNQTHKTDPRPIGQTTPAQMTFMDHIRELQSRLFYIALAFLAGSAAAYPFFSQIANAIVEPLGDQHLVYLTPGGAFSFVIKVCMYVGLIAALPVIMYQVFRFLSPVMPSVRRKKLVLFTGMSLLLAVAGIAFAYFISLPAALYFLTSFSVANIDPMLTIDSYFSFAMAYLVAGALLFQLPLILLVIDSVTPLTPKQLMGYQRHVILGSAILAAVLSPTPDAVNQLLLAAPIVVMYQIGLGFVAFQHRARTKAKRSYKVAKESPDITFDVDSLFEDTQPSSPVLAAAKARPVATVTEMKPVTAVVAAAPKVAIQVVEPTPFQPKTRSVDGFSVRQQTVRVPSRIVEKQFRRVMANQYSRRSLDGMVSVARS